MNFKNILQQIEKADPEVYERLSGRRQILKSFGSKVAVAALPLAIGSMFKKAYGRTTDVVVDALNFALELEYLEFAFYHTANNTGNLIPAADQPGFLTIEAHEQAHVNFLTTTITAMGGTPFVPMHFTDSTTRGSFVPAAYDFTGGGAYNNVFNDYPTFLILAEVFEDTGVRAYGGQMSVFSGNSLLVQAQQIATVEARHAAHVRLIRRNAGASELPAPWITNNIPPTTATQANYLGEDNTIQGVGAISLDITTITDGTGTVPKSAATAAFDEPLDSGTVTTLVSPFLKP